MRFVFLLVVSLATALPALAQPPTVPQPTIDIEWDHSDDWDRVYEAGTLEATAVPYISEYRLTITRIDTKAITSTVIPRAQVVRNQSALRVNGIAVPFGSITLSIRAHSRTGLAGPESNVVPFVSAGPAPAAVTRLRIP